MNHTITAELRVLTHNICVVLQKFIVFNVAYSEFVYSIILIHNSTLCLKNSFSNCLKIFLL